MEVTFGYLFVRFESFRKRYSLKMDKRKEIDKELREFLAGKNTWRILWKFFKKVQREAEEFKVYDSQIWTCGPCACLAKALCTWIGKDVSIYALCQKNESSEAFHLLVRVGDFYLDGDGVSSSEEIFKRWSKNLVEDLTLVPFENHMWPQDFYSARYEELHVIRPLIKMMERGLDRSSFMQLGPVAVLYELEI
jgi:hypothetical protein